MPDTQTTTADERTAAIERALAQHSGSLERFRHWTQRIIYTPGVADMAEICSAYWLIDLVASHQITASVKAEEFQVWTLTVAADRVSTRGDAFALSWEDRTVSERRTAGALILSKLRLAERAGKKGEFALGSLGGFELRGDLGRGFFREVEASLVLLRTDFDQEIRIEADLTQIGLIARLEHILEHFEADLREQERRAHDAADRLTGYEQRLGQPFALQAELDAKLAQLEALEADLAQTGKDQTGKADAGKLAA